MSPGPKGIAHFVVVSDGNFGNADNVTFCFRTLTSFQREYLWPWHANNSQHGANSLSRLVLLPVYTPLLKTDPFESS